MFQHLWFYHTSQPEHTTEYYYIFRNIYSDHFLVYKTVERCGRGSGDSDWHTWIQLADHSPSLTEQRHTDGGQQKVACADWINKSWCVSIGRRHKDVITSRFYEHFRFLTLLLFAPALAVLMSPCRRHVSLTNRFFSITGHVHVHTAAVTGLTEKEERSTAPPWWRQMSLTTPSPPAPC